MPALPTFFQSAAAPALGGVLLAAFLGFALPASAQSGLVGEDYKKVEALISAKNYAAAAQAADAYLASHLRDPQMRMLKSRIQIAQGKPDDARATLLTLTQDYPEIAEPYNNLAVLYAEAGQLDLARAAHENALRIHPNYATALHNLGDIYRRMAHDSYAKALAQQPGSKVLQDKVQALK